MAFRITAISSNTCWLTLLPLINTTEGILTFNQPTNSEGAHYCNFSETTLAYIYIQSYTLQLHHVGYHPPRAVDEEHCCFIRNTRALCHSCALWATCLTRSCQLIFNLTVPYSWSNHKTISASKGGSCLLSHQGAAAAQQWTWRHERATSKGMGVTSLRW